jgi:hypothetical protein
LRSDLKTEVKEKMRQSRGTETAGIANQFILGDIFQDQAQPWEELAKTHMRTIVAPELATLKKKLLEKLDEFTAHLNGVLHYR